MLRNTRRKSKWIQTINRHLELDLHITLVKLSNNFLNEDGT